KASRWMASTVGPTIETLPASNAKTNTKGSTTKLQGPAATYPASTPTISAEPIAHRACAVVTGPRGVSDTLTDAQAATRTDAAAMATRGFGMTRFGHAAKDRPSGAARPGLEFAVARVAVQDASVGDEIADDAGHAPGLNGTGGPVITGSAKTGASGRRAGGAPSRESGRGGPQKE